MYSLKYIKNAFSFHANTQHLYQAHAAGGVVALVTCVSGWERRSYKGGGGSFL